MGLREQEMGKADKLPPELPEALRVEMMKDQGTAADGSGDGGKGLHEISAHPLHRRGKPRGRGNPVEPRDGDPGKSVTDPAAENALSGAEFDHPLRYPPKLSEGAQHPAAVAEETIDQPQVASTPHRIRIGGIKMIKDLRLEDSVHGGPTIRP
jgi:hypothetical protein